MFLVINYVNFAICPTILTQHDPTIFINILKVWFNNYVCKISPKYLFYIYFIFLCISRRKQVWIKYLDPKNRTELDLKIISNTN